MTTFFTSDTHFGHANIIKYCNRPFLSEEEMDEILIQNWNSVVKDNDTVYHLGDFCMGKCDKYIRRLNGYKNFIMGSHDTASTLGYMHVLKLPIMKSGHHIRLTLCHYSMRSWELSHYGHWHIFGHHHGSLEPYGMSFDVGVDCWDFYPISLDQLIEKMKTLKPIVDYSKDQ